MPRHTFRCKTENNGVLKKANVSKVPSNSHLSSDSQDFGLKGSNMQINIRLGSNRTYETTSKPLAISGCFKSEDCLHASLRRETLTTRKILSDRPATAGLSKRNPYSSLRRQAVGSLTSREESTVNVPPRDWVPPASSQSWSSSVDSELATQGSFDTEVSLDDKQSFAVFSSVSGDSREDLAQDKMQQEISAEQVFLEDSRSNFANQLQQPIAHSGQSTCRFQSPRFEKISIQSNCSKKEDSETPHRPSESEMVDESIKNQPLVNNASFKMRPFSAQTTSNRDTETLDKNQPLLVTEFQFINEKKELVSKEVEEQHEAALINDSVDEVSSIRTPSDESEKSFQNSTKKPETNEGENMRGKVTKREPNMLSEILSFLDDANHQTANSPLPVINSETESNAGGFTRPGYESVSKLHGMSMAQLTEEVLGLQMLVQDKDNKLIVMERALQHQRELLARNVKTAKRELNLRCKAQKEEYEATLNRHVQFIQQLVEEKKSLAGKCETLATEMRQQATKVEYEKRINDERHNNEIRRLKQNLGKDQRYHQEKWLADRTEHIREATARGLEPELRRLMGQHQIELQSLRSIHQEELIRIEQAHLSKTVQQLNALREKMDNDREEACAKEREIMRLKYDKQLDEMETIHASKCQRLQAEIERERGRWNEEESRMKSQEEEKFRRFEEKRRREKTAAQQLLQVEIETLKQHHVEHLAQLRKKWEDDKNEELAALRHAMEMNFNDRERRILETQRRERDEEAQKFGSHFSNELKRQHEQWKTLSEHQVQRIREKNAEEIKRLDQAESELRSKLTEIRRTLTERDEEMAALRLTLFQHVKENKDMKKTVEQYSLERFDLRKVLQKELDDEFLKLNEEKRQLLEDLSRIKSEHRIEMNKKNSEMSHMSASHEQMLSDIHEKVKQAVAKKDDALAQMQERLKIAISRCQHLEELLDRQQRDLLARKN